MVTALRRSSNCREWVSSRQGRKEQIGIARVGCKLMLRPWRGSDNRAEAQNWQRREQRR